MIMAQPNSPGNFRGAGRDPRLSSFAFGGHMDGARPDGQMATTLEAVTGASGRPPTEASDDDQELVVTGRHVFIFRRYGDGATPSVP